jgi:hypothetical protein
LTPLVFSSGGFYKTFYREKLQNVNDMRDRIFTAAECFSNKMPVSTWKETEYLLDVCCATNGAHIEI